VKKLLTMMVLLLVAVLSAQSIPETLAQIETAKAELASNEKIVEQKIAELRASNPLFAPQDTFESDFEYLARLTQASPQIERIRKQYLDDIWLKLNKLRSRTWETQNITVTFGQYEPNSQVWDISVRHNEHQKELHELKESIERTTAKTINDNQSRLLIKGTLTVDLADRIGLAKLLIRDPVTAFEIKHDFHPIQKFEGKAVVFSPNGKLLAINRTWSVIIYDLETRQEIAEFRQDNNGVASFAFSPDGKSLAMAFENHTPLVFNIETRQQSAEFEVDSSVSSVAFSPDGKFLALGSWDSKALIFNLETRQQVAELKCSSYVFCVNFSPDGKFLAAGCGEGYSSKALIFNLETRQQIAEFKHGNGVNSVAFSPDGKFLATGCWDKKARIFDLATNKEKSSFEHGKYVVWSPVGNYFACSGNKKTQIMDLSTGSQHYLYDVEGDLSFSPDGRFLAIGDAIYRTMITAEGSEGEKLISRPPQLIASVEFNEPSGNRFLDALEQGSLKLSVSNSGQGEAAGITVKLDPAKISGLNYLNGFIAGIPAGKTVTLDIPLEAYIDVQDGTHSLNISFEEANGFPPAPLQITFSTRAYKRPELYISETGIDDSNKNGKIEAGEMIELTLRIRNRGEGPASGAYAKFYNGENVFITEKHPKTQALNELKSGQSVDLPLEIFINERCGNEIPLYVDLTEATGLATVNKLRVPITKSDATREISRVVVTGVDAKYTPDNPAALNIDVEQDIPTAKEQRLSDYAVIFGVEQYPSPVPRAIYAGRDATWFREYALKTLGIPESNVYFRVNEAVTKNEFDKIFGRSGWLDLRAQADSRVYFFFSGHGIPSEGESKAYVLPYDGDPNYAALTAYPLQNVYDGLSQLKSSQNFVFLDACFTGMARENHSLYATSRPVYMAGEKLDVPAKVNVLSASDSKQMSNAWPEKQHGLFSYFLLKGMQGSADANNDKQLTVAELNAYLSREVPPQAGRLDKEQNPQFSGSMQEAVLIEYN